MYCKKCNHLLDESKKICHHCGYDNSLEENNKLKEMKTAKKKTNKHSIVIMILLIFIAVTISLIITYTIKDIKKEPIPNMTSSTTTEEMKTKKFKYDSLIMEYPDNFGVASNVIFLKDNSSINIEINKITFEEYNNYCELNEHLTSKIGEIESITFADDSYYAHLFQVDSKYYIIKVNYINDTTVYTENIQLAISKILNTLKKK